MSLVDAVNDPATGRFVESNSGYRLRKAAREAIRTALVSEYHFDGAAAAVLLPIITEHLFDAARARKKNDRVRAANAARRLLATVSKRETLWP
jgi:hypothetical protein